MDASASPVEAVLNPPRFSKEYRVRFSHCDPAGIVFFPQYLILLNGFIEDWVTEGLGINYYDLFLEGRIGLPTASLNCEFVRPSRMGETLRHSLRVERVGRRSLTLAIEAACDGQTRWRMSQVLVTVDLNSGRSVDLPAPLRAALAAGARPADESGC